MSVVKRATLVQVRPSGYLLVLQQEGARHAFVEFLNAGAWLPRLAVAQVTKRRNTMGLDPVHQSLSEEESVTLTNNQDEEPLFDTVLKRPQQFQVVFPLFLSSPQYEKWVIDNICGGAMSLKIKADDLDLCDASKHPVARSLDEAILSADWEELPYMRSRGGDWLKRFINSVDTLPLSVSLATARSSRPGYPLVYANISFLGQCGYTRKEIIGCCNNLHVKHSDPATNLLLENALSFATPVSAVINCARKDGSLYSSLYVMKPVFDAHGQYSYVVSVQCDTTSSEQMLACVHALLCVLPNVLA